MSSTLLSRRDLDFLLHEWLNVSDLTKHPRFRDHSRDTFDAVLEVSEKLAAREFRTHNRTSDLNEPHFDGTRVHMIPEVRQALSAFAESGLLAGTVDEDLGGIQLPHTVHRACFAYFQAANIATSGYPMLSMANANLLIEHGSADQVREYVIPLLEGRFFGTMCLSEPHAGSSLADVTTRARPDGDGRHRLFGQKMWISGGDHELGENIVHLVLARVDGAKPGVKGLSLFIVPKFLGTDDGGRERNDVALAGLNHKMGWRGITNTLLSFGEGSFRPTGESGAVGYLVGEENRGLEYMFHMMNEARIGVGAGAAALGYTGYLEALEYARTRPQGRLPGHKDPSSPQVPIIEHPDVRRMLLAAKSYAEGAMALVLYAAKLLDESTVLEDPAARAEAGRLLDVLTPIVKSWPSQWCLRANDLSIQVHGGAGYTRDHNVEQFYRDNRLNPIHEGTHGIHGLDLLGRKVVMDSGAGLDLLVARMRQAIDTAPDDLIPWAGQLSARVDRLVTVTAALWRDGDAELALSNATLYLEAVGHIVIAWLWLEQAGLAVGETGTFYAGKLAAARYFFTYELPRVDAQLDLLAERDRMLLDLDPHVL
ncbi:acyl-CoA dehydrogenase [Streptomyces justiciae]|uniref:acyl-CoA dehydrogenase n=1 Tax=Streptomyces justiciae TaxID=2780140 RepID=UPI002117616B|nr:acyl-CoA dehydrogenase [Streptomyces justiciae]MCW8378710.1 acyl-CoA dehydrogenase [Streptomyces justiciae]